MKLHSPFEIGPRLTPSLRIQDSNGCAWLSFDNGQFIIDLPDGTEHKVTGYSPGLSASRDLGRQFADILSFLSACAESRSYGRRRKGDPMTGENADLFPANVGEWAEQMSDELTLLQLGIEETETDLIEDHH